MRLLAVLVVFILPFELLVAGESAEYSSVARIKIQPGPLIVGDSLLSGEASSISVISALVNEEAAYFSYPSPIQGSNVTTYFFYARNLTVEFRCVILENEVEVAANISRVRVELEPGALYFAVPAFLDNYSSCETNVVPQPRPNKSFNPTPGNSRAGQSGLARWRRGLS